MGTRWTYTPEERLAILQEGQREGQTDNKETDNFNITFAMTSFLCLLQKEHLEPRKDLKLYKDDLKEFYDRTF